MVDNYGIMGVNVFRLFDGYQLSLKVMIFSLILIGEIIINNTQLPCWHGALPHHVCHFMPLQVRYGPAHHTGEKWTLWRVHGGMGHHDSATNTAKT